MSFGLGKDDIRKHLNEFRVTTRGLEDLVTAGWSAGGMSAIVAERIVWLMIFNGVVDPYGPDLPAGASSEAAGDRLAWLLRAVVRMTEIDPLFDFKANALGAAVYSGLLKPGVPPAASPGEAVKAGEINRMSLLPGVEPVVAAAGLFSRGEGYVSLLRLDAKACGKACVGFTGRFRRIFACAASRRRMLDRVILRQVMEAVNFSRVVMKALADKRPALRDAARESVGACGEPLEKALLEANAKDYMSVSEDVVSSAASIACEGARLARVATAEDPCFASKAFMIHLWMLGSKSEGCLPGRDESIIPSIPALMELTAEYLLEKLAGKPPAEGGVAVN